MSQAPDLTKIGAMSSPQNMNLSTSIVEPIQHDDSFCRFVLMNRGILHSNSKLQIALSATGKDSFLALGVGSHGLIQRCVLKSGSKTISETDDWNHLQNYQSMFVSNEAKAEREGVLTGRVGHYGYTSDDKIRIENFHDFDGTNQKMHGYQNLNSQPTWQVTLSELFPFMKQIQLPLYCMKDQLSIEIHFAPVANRYWYKSGESAGTFTIDKTQTKLVVDYIYYDQDSMDTYQQQIETKGFQIPIFDHVLIRNSITLTANAMASYTRNLGCANRMVNKVIIANTNENQSTGSFCNTYNSQWNEISQDKGDFLVNLKYNDRSVWPRDIDSSAHAFSLLTAAESLPPFLLKNEYDGSQGALITTNTFEGYDLSTASLNCPKRYIALQPNRGDRINGRGLDLNITMKNFPAQSPVGTALGKLTQRVWCETAKVISLKDGRLSCVYA